MDVDPNNSGNELYFISVAVEFAVMFNVLVGKSSVRKLNTVLFVAFGECNYVKRLNENPSQSCRASPATRYHSVTCHLMQVTHFALTPARQASTRFTYHRRMDS